MPFVAGTRRANGAIIIRTILTVFRNRIYAYEPDLIPDRFSIRLDSLCRLCGVVLLPRPAADSGDSGFHPALCRGAVSGGIGLRQSVPVQALLRRKESIAPVIESEDIL